MVRVGGGWADLGEYLKEYASHHGRRSEQPGKVEIQDLPQRVVSTGSTASTSTLRNGTWNTSEASSPVSRPGSRPSSALGRPLSSLAIRKTRKSVGEEAREKAYRSPSTPLPPSLGSSPSAPRPNETPPSATSARSVSQMSWREEESNLGLAGPRSRKGEISAENAAWVESMKEKVRIASAEKEKKEKAAFGDMGQVGATKRLFKRSG
jgi:Growth-Arrest-Specific Protein 2 Domain